jgi:uncharacterized membrane protein YfcA
MFPEIELTSVLIACSAAFIAAVVDAIAGGGGVIVFPTLMFLGLPVELILGTNKFVSTCGTAVATRRYIKTKNYSPFVIRYGIVCTAIGAVLGSYCASLLPSDWLKPLVSTLIILIALYFFFRPQLGVVEREARQGSRYMMITLVAGTAIGFYDGIFGPGTGAFLIFVFIKVMHHNFVLAAGNTKILNLTSNIAALAVFAAQGQVDWRLGIPMALVGMCGGHVGAHIAISQGASWIRWIFIVMAFAVAGRLIYPSL